MNILLGVTDSHSDKRKNFFIAPDNKLCKAGLALSRAAIDGIEFKARTRYLNASEIRLWQTAASQYDEYCASNPNHKALSASVRSALNRKGTEFVSARLLVDSLAQMKQNECPTAKPLPKHSDIPACWGQNVKPRAMTYTTNNGTCITLVTDNNRLKGFNLSPDNGLGCECRFKEPLERNVWNSLTARGLADGWDKLHSESPYLANVFLDIAHGTKEIKSLEDAVNKLSMDYLSRKEIVCWDELGMKLFMKLRGRPTDSQQWTKQDKAIIDSLDGLLDWKKYASRNADLFDDLVVEDCAEALDGCLLMTWKPDKSQETY